MRLFKVRLQESAKARGLTLLVIERDYVQSYILAGIAARPALRHALIFKGGTALKKVHFGEYRFSEDLDFSAVGAPIAGALEEELRQAVAIARQMVRVHADIELELERHVERDTHPGGQDAFVIRVKYPWHPRPMVNIKLEITHDEPVLLTHQVLKVAHGYDEPLECHGRSRADDPRRPRTARSECAGPRAEVESRNPSSTKRPSHSHGMIAPGVAHCARLGPCFMTENPALPILFPTSRSLTPTHTTPPYFATSWKQGETRRCWLVHPLRRQRQLHRGARAETALG